VFGPRVQIDTAEDIRPDAQFLNIHHAIHKLLVMSGAAEAVWAGMTEGDDNDVGGPDLTFSAVQDIPYLGHSDTTDDMFLDSLSQRLQFL
jgi:hypothetical protein